MRKNRFALLTIAVASALAFTTACGSPVSKTRVDTLRVDTSSTFAYTGPEGLTVKGAAGVAAPDTLVTITPQQHPHDENLPGLTYLGRSVEIVLGDKMQPKAPIAVSIPVPRQFEADTATIIAVTQDDGNPEFLPVTAANGLLTANLVHLSPLDFFTVDISKFTAGVTASLRTLLTGESATAPDCLEKSVDVGGVTVKAHRAKSESGGNLDAIWPCLRYDHGQLLLDLHANGNRAWLTRSQPDAGTGALSAPGSGDATAVGFFKLFYSLGKHRSTGTLMPGTTLTYAFSADNLPTRAEAKVDPGLMLTAALVYQITAIFDMTGMSTYDEMEKVPGAYDCLLGAADTLDTTGKTFLENFSSAFATIVGCLATVVPGPMAFLLNIFGSGAQIVAGLVNAAWNEFTNDNHAIITISNERPRADYAQTWTGHTRLMHLQLDGTGDVTIFSGASDGETWSATWETTAAGIAVSLVARTSKSGAGLADLHPGTKWDAALLKSSDQKTILHFVDPGADPTSPQEGFFWCSDKYGYSYDCGA